MKYTREEIAEQQANQPGGGCFLALLLMAGVVALLVRWVEVADLSSGPALDWVFLGFAIGLMIAFMPSRRCDGRQ